MGRPITRQDIETAYGKIAETCMLLRTPGQELAPQALIFGLGEQPDEVPPITEVPREVVDLSFKSGEGKKFLGNLLRMVLALDSEAHTAFIKAHGWEPRMTVVVSEAWMISRLKDEPHEGPPSEQPDRIEVVMIAINTSERSYVGNLPIVDGKVTFVPLDLDMKGVSGRLATHVTQDDIPVRH